MALGVYLAALCGVVWALTSVRARLVEASAQQQAEVQWQHWREATQEMAQSPGPVARRAVRTGEPPMLVLLRDHFVAVLLTCLAATTLLLGFLWFALRGSLATQVIVDAADNPLPGKPSAGDST